MITMLKVPEYNTITGEKIDLKELEKYGLIINKRKFCRIYDTKRVKAVFGDINDKYGNITISDKNAIDFQDYCDKDVRLDILYDLIKDGYVVKEDNKWD